MAQSQLTPFLLFFLATPKRLLQRPSRIWAAKVMPLLFAILLINFYGNLNSGITALGFLPLLMITPLTVATALRSNTFHLFCLYTSVLTFGISALLPFKPEILETGLDEVVRINLRILVICLISQAVNLSTIQLCRYRRESSYWWNKNKVWECRSCFKPRSSRYCSKSPKGAVTTSLAGRWTTNSSLHIRWRLG
jgi:hypothetical protein